MLNVVLYIRDAYTILPTFKLSHTFYFLKINWQPHCIREIIIHVFFNSY